MTTGRFDVVVVGARARGTQAVMDLAVAVGRVTGLAPGAVQRGLEGGEVVVHAGLSKTQAVVAARTVQQLGAIVDVRPARSDDGGPTIEPDEESLPAELEGVLESVPSAVPTSPPPIVIVPPPPPAAAPRPTASVPPPNPAGPLIDPNAPALDLGGPPVATRFVPPAAMDAKLELDFKGAGLTAPPPGTSALMRGSATPPSGAVARGSGSFPAVDPGARAPVSGGHPTIAAAPAPGLLAYDRIASGLFGTAIAAAIGMVIAFAFVRGDAKEVGERLEPELREAIGDPVGVEAGRRRAPATIVAEIEDALAEVRTTYLLVWAGIALPFGMLAGLLRRPS